MKIVENLPYEYELYTSLFRFMTGIKDKWAQPIYDILIKQKEKGLSFTELRKRVFVDGVGISEQRLSKSLDNLQEKGIVKKHIDNYIAEDKFSLIKRESFTGDIYNIGGNSLNSLSILGIKKLDETEDLKKKTKDTNKLLIKLKDSVVAQQKKIFREYFKSSIEKVKPYELKVFLRDNRDAVFRAITNVLSERGKDIDGDFHKFFSIFLINKKAGKYYSQASQKEICKLIKILKGIWGGSPVGPIKIIWKDNNYNENDLKNFEMVYNGVSNDGYLD